MAQAGVLVITPDLVGASMAGPAIRAWNMATVLSDKHEVRLVSLNPSSSSLPAPFQVKQVRPRDMAEDLAWADVVVVQGSVLEQLPALRDSDTVVVCDLYDPMHLEQLEQAKDAGEEQRARVVAAVTTVLTNQLVRGDFFLCASQRQRYFWLGHLGAIGRLNPDTYDADPTGNSLLALAPFGLPDTAPVRTGAAARGVLPGVGERDKVIIWAGGVYSWFDPLTLIRAVGLLSRTHADARLVFLGMRHPNPDIGEMDIAARTRALACELGLTGKHVFFNETWVPYDQRQNWLLDADCGVTTHFEHLETTFAFRTRVLDYLWAGLPIVTTDGDSFAELVHAQRLGVVVPAQDPVALAEALSRVLYDEAFAQSCRDNIARVRERFTWPTVLAPLAEFCANPRQAADRVPGARSLVAQPPPPGSVRRDLGLVREYLKLGGPGELVRRVGGRVRRVAGQRLRRGGHG